MPVDAASDYPAFFISGWAILVMVGAVSTDDPQIAANPPQAPTVARPSPPLNEPTHTRPARNNSAYIP